MRAILERATRPVDAASLAAFRVLFGAVMFASTIRYVRKGWVETQLVRPSFHFTYEWFSFVRPLPGYGMELLFFGLALAALGVALGCCYRLSAVAFLLGFSYVELIDKTVYLNHYYLVSLLAGLLAVLPAGQTFSIDARLRPERHVSTVPAWTVFALRLQVGVVYFFAGIAKLNPDWLFRAQPLRIWLAARSELPVIGSLLGEPTTASIASFIGALFDLGIVWLLLLQRTRSAAFVAAVLFHAVTGLLLPIGIFPFLMVAGATVFLSPDWPRRFVRGRGEHRAPAIAARVPRSVGVLVLAHAVLQVALPLRGVFERAPTAWTLRGFNFAWKVMVAEKAGAVSYRVRDKRTRETVRVEPGAYLTPVQERAMAQDPEMIRALAVHVAKDVARREGRDVAVFADAFASLNGRPSVRLVDATVDLAEEPRGAWILPLAVGD